MQRSEYLSLGKTPPRCNLPLKLQVTQERWNEESPEFREAVCNEVQATYDKAMEDYDEAFKNIPKSGKEYDWCVPTIYSACRVVTDRCRTLCRAVEQSYAVLQPLVDLIAMKFGTVATLWMAGPQGAKADINCVRCVLRNNLDAKFTHLRNWLNLVFIPEVPLA